LVVKSRYIVTVQGKGTYVAAQNKELLKESQLKIIEEKLTEAVEAGKSINLTLEEMQEILKVIYEEG
ncbi:GntR family transcriptional regulator, partial [Geobacillus thermoleovorans]